MRTNQRVENKGEPQKRVMLDDYAARKLPIQKMGLATGYGWHDDPRRLAFMLSRYKFVAKMLEGRKRVLEVGCGDGFGTRIVSQCVDNITAIDFDPDWIASAIESADPKFQIEFHEVDVLEETIGGPFDAVFALDVVEHIRPEDEDKFLLNCIHGLVEDGVCIIGMPSLESQVYASEGAKRGHVNCKTQEGLRRLMDKFFKNIFMFSANDEMIHTGYARMSHYNIALCCGRR
jgi:SAM-dependent methyltransferase